MWNRVRGDPFSKIAGMRNTPGLSLFRTGGDRPLTSELVPSHLECDLAFQSPNPERALD